MNPMAMMNMMQSFSQNPMAMLSKRFNIPQGVNTADPGAILRHLVDSGQVSQAQINQIMSMRNNPMFGMLGRK
jgi:hypothetical protein